VSTTAPTPGREVEGFLAVASARLAPKTIAGALVPLGRVFALALRRAEPA